MPLIKVQTTVEIPEEKKGDLLASLSKLLVEGIGKPEQYVMALIEPASIRMSGQAGPAAFAEVRSIGGLSSEVNTKISEKLCQLLESSLSIPPERVYVNFAEIAASHWGWRGSTFG